MTLIPPKPKNPIDQLKLALQLMASQAAKTGNRLIGRENMVKTAKKTQVMTRLAIVEADALIASHNEIGTVNPAYPAELQPRDRARTGSIEQVQKIANDIDHESLGRSGRADSGAPIIGDDMVVESGNGRTIALKLAYATGKAEQYREWLIDEAEYFGMTAEQIEKFDQPVLVRIRQTDIDRKQFTIEANQDDKLAYSATERAKTDAGRISGALLDMFDVGDSGDLLATSNLKFIQAFLKELGSDEAAQYITSDGKPTQGLVTRIKAALFSKAYSDDRLLEMMADQTKPELQNVLNALSAAAPRFIEAKAVSKSIEGHIEDLSSKLVDGIEASLDDKIINAIIDATNVISRAKQNDQNIAEYVSQQGLFEDLPDGVGELAIFIANNTRSAKKLSIAFKAMAEFSQNASIDSQNFGLFGEPEPVKLIDAINYANSKLEIEYGDNATISLFDSLNMTAMDIQADPLAAIAAMIQALQDLEQQDNAPFEHVEAAQGAYKLEGKITPRARQKANDDAVALLKSLQESGTPATAEQKAILSRYTGTGGNLMGDDGLKGSAYEYYTPIEVAETMWDLMREQGFEGGNVLDPSSGTGIFATSAPKNILMHSVELSELSGGINKLVNGTDKHAVTVSPFEKVAASTEDETFDAIITNVPFGSNSDRGENKYFDNKYQKDNLQEYFIKRSLDKLRPSKLAMFIVPTSIMDGKGAKEKNLRNTMLLRADLVGAYRLPNKVFDATGADVTTDIIVLRKHSRDVRAKIENLYENGGQATLEEAQVLDVNILKGMYFKTYGLKYILGKTAIGKGQWGDVERVVNDDSLANILKLIRRFPDSRINYELLDATDDLDEVQFNDGDIRQIDGATFELKNGEWQQVIRQDSFDTTKYATPFAMLSADIDYAKLNDYIAFVMSVGKRVDSWINVLTKTVEKKPESLGFWLCILSVVEALKTSSSTAYSARFSELTKYMIGYADAYNTKQYKTGNNDYKRYLQSVSVAFDAAMPDGLSRFWHGQVAEFDDVQTVGKHAAYEAAIYRGEVTNWQVDVDVIKQTRPDFDPLTDNDYCINEDGTKVTLARDYYVGNLAAFNDRIDAQIAAATDPAIKGKLIQQRLTASSLVSKVDVSKLNYGLMATNIPIDIKFRYFSEFIDTKTLLDGDNRLVIDEKIESVENLAYRLERGNKLTGKMDDKVPMLRHFMLNRIFNSINNNQRLYIKGDGLKAEQKDKLLTTLTDYFNQLNTSFDAWLKSNTQFMAELDRKFNAPENKTLVTELDGSPLNIDGFKIQKGDTVYQLHDYQNEEVRRLSRSFKGICGFDVGLGKTNVALATVQNMHNIGVKKRTFFVVPNHTISKWFNDMKSAYDDTSDVLVIGSNAGKQASSDSKYNAADFALLTKPDGKKYRKILMTVDAFGMIPLREDTITKHWNLNVSDISSLGSKKDVEKATGALSTRIQKINKYESKLAYFEDMGVDSLIFDEAQLFKNGKAGGGNFDRIKGLALLSEGTLSSRAISAAIKSWYVRGQNGELADGVVLLTATPFTNSPVEILTMLSLAIGDKEALREFGGESINNVDDFLSTFANIEGIEQENIVNELVATDTFTGFKNANLLKDSIHKVANIQTARERGLQIPNEDNVSVAVDLNADDQAALGRMKSFYEIAKLSLNDQVGYAMLNQGARQAYEDFKATTGETDELIAHPFNLISRMSDVIMAGSEMGIMRIVPIDFEPKQLELAKKVAKQFNDKKISLKTMRRFPGVDADLISIKTMSDEDGNQTQQFTIQTQVTIDDHNSRIVLNVDDTGVLAQLMEMINKASLTVKPKLSAKVSAMIDNFKNELSTPMHEGHAKQLIFCDNLAMQQIIKCALIAYAGLSAGKIAIINGQTLPDGTKGNPDTEHVQEIQDKFKDNVFTVVIANKKAETGIDLQNGTQAIHHLTTGWTPDSIQQRNGRGVRQGNKQAKVSIYMYNANGTFDEYKQRLIAGKADWIDQLMQKDGSIDGTLTVARELSKQDYEDLIKADNPEQIAALLAAKQEREATQQANTAQARTKLLYDNMLKAKGRPAPTIVSQVQKTMEQDAKKLIDLIKKRDKAKEGKQQEYADQINQIASKYDGWFDGRLTTEIVIKGATRSNNTRGDKPNYLTISKEIAWGENGMRPSAQDQWIEDNADTLTNDVFNRARNIVETAKNMVKSTADSFMNYGDSDLSQAQKAAILADEAAIDAMGVYWAKGEYVSAQIKGETTYGYISLVETSMYGQPSGMIPMANINGKSNSTDFFKVKPSDKQAALEYMVNYDIAECTRREVFDVDTAKPFYSKTLPEIRNMVADRLGDKAIEWEEGTTKTRLMFLMHKSGRRYWYGEYFIGIIKNNPDLVSEYNSIFEFVEPPSPEYGDVRNRDLKDYSTSGYAPDSLFFTENISRYLRANNKKIIVPNAEVIKVIGNQIIHYSGFVDAVIDGVPPSMSSLQIKELLSKTGVTEEKLIELTTAAIESEEIFANAREMAEYFVETAEFERNIRPQIKIVDESGEQVIPDFMALAERVATMNTRNEKVIGLKSTISGRNGNVLFDNKDSLKRIVKYAYWSGKQTMWIIDLESFEKVTKASWYDANKIDIVEAKYR